MKSIALQKQGQYLVPHSEEDALKLASYKENQIIHAKVSGFQKPRSVEQLRLYWSLCRIVAENSDSRNWNNKDKVSLQIKLALDYCDYDNAIVVDGEYSYAAPRSISFEKLEHMEACNYFDRAFEVMAGRLGVSVEEMIKQVEGGEKCQNG